jgi:hypothetical protein
MPALLDQLNKTYFWDVNPATLQAESSGKLIIERVMNLGNRFEIKLILEYYGLEEVKNTLVNLNYIDPKTLNFISLLLRIPKAKFKCYTRKQLTSRHWSF